MKITGRTPVYAVFGDPVSHSLSPLLHNFWIGEHGLDAVYVALPIKRSLLAQLPASGLAGANVTAPFKEIAAQSVQVSGPAAALGAANTLWREADGGWSGINTDAPGFAEGLEAAVPGWRGGARQALVLGAGGAGRAVALGLAQAGLERVWLANRDEAKAARGAALHPAIAPLKLAQAPEMAAEADVLVNALSADAPDQLLLQVAAAAKPGAAACDIIYSPRMTPFLTAAAARGLTPIDGLYMLVGQAALAFQHWFGVAPDRAAGRRRLLSVLEEDRP